jgi:TolB protein
MSNPPETQLCPSRRRWLAGALAAGALHGVARAQFRVEISGVGATQLPVGVTKFREEDRSGQSISGIVRADLERSGVFRIVDSNGDFDETSRPAYPEWRGRGADALVAGSAARLSDGRFDVRYKLWDVVRGNELSGRRGGGGQRRPAPGRAPRVRRGV